MLFWSLVFGISFAVILIIQIIGCLIRLTRFTTKGRFFNED